MFVRVRVDSSKTVLARAWMIERDLVKCVTRKGF